MERLMGGASVQPRQLTLSLEVQAREQIQRIKDHWQSFWFELKDFHDNGRWTYLGYSSFKKCVEVEFGFTERRAYQLLEAAEVAAALGTENFFSTAVPNESQARALAPLLDDPNALAEAWHEAVEEAPRRDDGSPKVTAAGVAAVVQRRETKSHAVAHEERLASYEARGAERDAALVPEPFATAWTEDAPEEATQAEETTPTIIMAPPYGRIVRQDALSYLRFLQDQHPEARADVAITSPPYWAKRTYSEGDPCELGQERDPADYVDALCTIVNEIGRVLTPEGCLFLNLGDTLASQPGQYRGDPNRRRGISTQAIRANATATAERQFDTEAEKTFCLIPESVTMRLVLDYGWRLAGKIVWHKIGHAPENVFDRLTQAWEPVYVLTRSQHAYFRRQPEGRDERPVDVWPIPVGRGGEAKGHLAPFPDELVARAIQHGCRPNGVVLDPFAGSGTTLRVAEQLGRRFLGCDLLYGEQPA